MNARRWFALTSVFLLIAAVAVWMLGGSDATTTSGSAGPIEYETYDLPIPLPSIVLAVAALIAAYLALRRPHR